MVYSLFSIDPHRIMSLNHVTPPILVIFTMVSTISHAPSMPRFRNIGANEISQRHRQESGHAVGRNGAEKHGHGAFRAALGTQRRGRDEGAITDFRGEDQEEGLVDGRYWKDLGKCPLDVLVLASKTSELDFRPCVSPHVQHCLYRSSWSAKTTRCGFSISVFLSFAIPVCFEEIAISPQCHLDFAWQISLPWGFKLERLSVSL